MIPEIIQLVWLGGTLGFQNWLSRF